jgi:uncharacterized protein involved in exopolysaccharide biosynthesis/Mrp family chromosome partitioning ATPase
MVQAKAKYREILWHYRWFALTIFVAVLAMGYVGVRVQPKVYGVSADIYVEPRPVTVTGDSTLAAADNDYRQINNQVEILGSDRVANKAADYIGKQLGSSFLIDGRQLAKMITITKKEYSSVITLELSSSVKPHTLLTIIQEYLHAYEDALEMINSDKSSRERDFLAKQLESAQVELDHVSHKLRDFESQNAAYNMDVQVNQMLQEASGLDEQAKVLNSDIQATSQEIMTAQKALPVSPEYINLMSRIERDPEASELRKRIVAMETEKAEWGSKVTEAHPKMGFYTRQLQRLNQLLNQRLAVFSGAFHGLSEKDGAKITTSSLMDSNLAESLMKNRIRLDSLRAKEKALIDAHHDVTELLKTMPQQVVEYASLKNTYEMAQEKVKLLQKRLDDASLMQEVSKRFTKVEILKNPVLPVAPLRPNLLRNMTAAALLGFCLALFSVYVRCAMDQTFRWPFQLNGLREPNLFLLDTAPDRKTFAKALGQGTIGAPDSYKRLMVHLESLSQKEGVRRIGLLPVGGNPHRGIPAITLALSMTEAGHKVALLDVDFTRLSVSQLVEGLNLPLSAALQNGPGLSDYLSGEVEDFVDIIYPLGKSIYGSLIPAGNPLEGTCLTVSRRSWEQLEESLSPNYNFVFYSLPAINQSYDAVAVSLAMDGVLLLVYPGASMQDQIQQSLQELKTVGAHVLGIIIQPL